MDPLHIARVLTAAAADAWDDSAHLPGLGDDVGMGADGTPTTRADAILDAAVLQAAKDIGVSVLSEEAGLIDHGSELVAVVDPLDGSRNAGRGIPFFCTSIAVGHQDISHIEAGVVRNLVSGTRYEADAKGPRMDGRPMARGTFDPDEVMVAVITDSAVEEVLQEQERRGHHLRDLGSAALELCLVATGSLDAFLVRQPWLRVVDIAAGAFIAEKAGCIVQDGTGAPLATPFNLDVRTGVVAAHSPEALEAVS